MKSLNVLGVVVSIASLVFFGRAITSHWNEIASAGWTGGSVAAASAAFALYCATLLLAAQVAAMVLAALGVALAPSRVRRIVLLSQIGKYLPGNVGHHIGRVALTTRVGVPAGVAVLGMSLEIGLALAASLLMACPVLSTVMGPALARNDGARAALLLAALVGSGVAGLLALAVPRVRQLLSRLAEVLTRARKRRLLKAFFVQVASFSLGGTALYALCLSGMSQPRFVVADWMSVLAAFAAAWTTGFVAPGAPAGLGVREVVLATILKPLFGPTTALAAPAILRLVTILGDGVVFLVARAWPQSEDASTAMKG